MRCDIDLFLNDAWHKAASFELNSAKEVQKGVRGAGLFEYDLDYAPAAGSSGAQGDVPKFLLTEDRGGRWHADGALPDDSARRHWLVKFPRGKNNPTGTFCGTRPLTIGWPGRPA